MHPDDRPIDSGEAARLFAACLGQQAGRAVALAVSGGCDSTALMVLFADWLGGRGVAATRHTVLTVDHGLRAESAGEAQQVARQARMLGFQHATLLWEGRKPRSGVQAAARRARYGLMREYLATHGIATLLTGHTRDDQAETLLMRLARGSGLDGLAGIAPAMDLPAVPGGAAVRILRPLLDLPKSRLEATLRQRGITWVEDPSNQSPAYERSRLRAARAALDAVGLTSETLAASARRLRRARAAVDAMAVEACGEASGVVRTDRCGFFSIDRRRLGRAPEEIFLRIIGRCIRAAGGADAPVSLSRLEALVAELRSRPALERGHWTLARAHIIADGEHLRIEREPGRAPLPVLAVAGGAAVVWDGRFAIETAPRLQGGLEVRALGSEGVREVARAGQTPARSRALRLVPAFWREGRLVAVPCVDFWAEAELRGQISATFLGLRYNWQGTEGSCPTTPQA